MTKNNKFNTGITGLSEDMEEFMLEQADYYFEHKTPFWTSFWKVCVDIWSNGVDLTYKQFTIVDQEYNKVKERIKEYKESLIKK